MPGIASHAPYPPSEVVRDLVWEGGTVRLGGERAGDNWPITWTGPDEQFTAYGDGYGFGPRDEVYTLGFATILGDPPDFRGSDVPSNIDTSVGWGSDGIKASGVLSVGGTLYLFVRNYAPEGDDFQHSRLAWSTDGGTTWDWADWYFSASFGCPEFVQFGPNYEGARDDYVYVCSQDGTSAYEFDTNVVLARVPKDRVTDLSAWQYHCGVKEGGEQVWCDEVRQRVPIFHDLRGTQRIAITYNRALERYFLVSSHSVAGGAPHTGALGVFDAPEPWGPWTTCYYDDEWSEAWMIHHKFPTKWMSDDGREMWLVFSGEYKDGGTDYCLMCRKAVLTT